jgi:alcohol dehydrogenase class IV
VGKRGLVHIAIPTTAGTGSELTRVTVINDTKRNVKMMCLDDAFMADAAIIDYELTLTMPGPITAYVGLDALTHAIEAYVSKKANPISDLFALPAIELIAGNIVEAFQKPDLLKARENMMQGASFAGIAFSNASVCAVHGMARPLGAYFHVPHGLSNAFLLPIVTQRSIDGNLVRYAEIADRVGCTNKTMDIAEKASSLAIYLKHLNKSLQIPTLQQWGIDHDTYESVVDQMAADALESGSPANNPKLFQAGDLVEIYRQAYE